MRTFISYRRADALSFAGRLYDRLNKEFGEKTSFIDIDAIPVGAEFEKFITSHIVSSNVLIAIISKNWIGKNSVHEVAKINSNKDFVRIELELAIANNIPIIPLLIEGASLPEKSSLPGSLSSIVDINALEISEAASFHDDVDILVETIRGMSKSSNDIASIPQTIEELEHMLFSGKQFKAANGEFLTWKEYLDRAIVAFNLQPMDYYSAHYVITKIGQQKPGGDIAMAINNLWGHVNEMYGPLGVPSD